MYCVRKVTDDLLWIGGNDRQHPLFESAHPVPRGMSFNSYLLLDEKTVLFDTVDRAVQTQFFENLEYALGGRKLDYVFVHHMEPDHAATLGDLMIRHPEATIVCNGKSLKDAKIYVALFPCNECAKAIIQTGIKKVVYLSNKYETSDSTKASRMMMSAAGIELVQLKTTRKEIVLKLEA